MKKGKSIACLLMAAVVASCTAGCSGSKTQSSAAAAPAPSPSQAASSSASSQEASANPQDKYKAQDLGGRQFVFAYNWDMIPATSDAKLDPKTANEEEINKLANLKRVEKKYNCKIKYINVPYDQISKKLTTSVMANQPFADAVNLSAQQVYPAILSNEILPLDGNVPDNSDIMHEKKVLYPVSYLGKAYAMGETNVGITGIYIAFNRDIIKQLGMDAPDELFKKGQWTWDNFMKLAKAATKDTNGDGKIDQWGLSGTPGRLAPLFVASNGGYLLDETNKKSGLDDPKTKEAFEFMNKIYNVEKVGYIAGNNPDDYNSNDYSFKQGHVAMFYCEDWLLPASAPKLSFNVGCAPAPKGPSNTTDSLYFKGEGGVCIPKGVKDPKMVAQVFEEVINWCGANFDKKEGTTTQWLETLWPTEDDVTRSIDISNKCAKIDYFSAIPDYPLGNVLDAFLKNKKTPAQAIEQNKQVAQSKVDAVFNKK